MSRCNGTAVTDRLEHAKPLPDSELERQVYAHSFGVAT